MLFKIENLNLEFGEKKIFEKVNFVFNEGDKIGMVGDNGTGKTSLFNVILQKKEFQGKVIFENKNFSYLTQDEGFEELKLIETRKKEIEKLLFDKNIIKNPEKYNELLEEYLKLTESNVSKNEILLMDKFNFNKELYFKEKKEHTSGGEITKLKLIKLFAKNYDYLLLDEPSNHLDLESKNNLIDELSKLKSFIIISHDINLLNSVCNKIVEIKNCSLKSYFGNYDEYLKSKEKEKERILKTQIEHKKEKKKIQGKIDDVKSWANKKMKEKTKHLAKGQILGDMGTGHGSMERGITVTAKKLIRMEKNKSSFETPELDKEEDIKISYLNFEKPNQIILEIKNLKKSFENFCLSIDNLAIEQNEKVALQGNNGSGKTTLLKLIMGELKQNKGIIKIGNKVSMGYLSQKNENLNINNSVLKEMLNLNLNLEEKEIRKYLGKFLFKGNEIFKEIKELSGGEKIRLGLLKLILSGCNFLILDEPSNHLDIRSKNILSEALKNYPGSILVVSHDDFFLDKFITKKIHLKQGKLI